jgi:hypothetical protein
MKTILSPVNLESVRKLIAELIAGEDDGQHQATKSYRQLNMVIHDFTCRLGFEEMASLLPEQERPVLIPFELPISTFNDGHLAYIIKLALAPECAFIAQMNASTGCSSKSVRIGYSAFRSNRSLTCFCEIGMNPESELGQSIDIISNLCINHGITHVIGRKASHQGQITFMDTEDFEDLARRDLNPLQLKKLKRFVWAD